MGLLCPVGAVVGLDLWSLIGAHGTWDVFAAAVRDRMVLWRVVFGNVDAFVSGLGAVVGGGELWCGGNRSKSRVIGAFGAMLVDVIVV